MYLYAKMSSICKLLCIISDRVPNFSFDTTKNSCMQPNLDHTWGPWSLWTLEVVTTMKRWILSLWLHPLSQLGATNWTMFLATVMFANALPRFKAPALMNFLTKECVLSALGLYLFWLFSLVPCFRTYLLPASLFFDKHVLRLTMPRLYFVLFLFSYLPTYLPACMLHIHFCAVILLQYILWPNFFKKKTLCFLLLCRVIVAYYTCCNLCSGTLKLQWRSRLLGKRKNAFRTRSSETFATSRHKQC